jgi:hypothetical protein
VKTLEREMEEFFRREADRLPDEAEVRSELQYRVQPEAGGNRQTRRILSAGLTVGLVAFAVVVVLFAPPLALLNNDRAETGSEEDVADSGASVSENRLVTEVEPPAAPERLPDGVFPFLLPVNPDWSVVSGIEEASSESGHTTLTTIELQSSNEQTALLELRSVPDDHILSSTDPKRSSNTDVLSRAALTQLVVIGDRQGIMYLVEDENDPYSVVYGFQWLEAQGVEATLVAFGIEGRDLFESLVDELERVDASEWRRSLDASGQ